MNSQGLFIILLQNAFSLYILDFMQLIFLHLINYVNTHLFSKKFKLKIIISMIIFKKARDVDFIEDLSIVKNNFII